jgi:hypothetical protein
LSRAGTVFDVKGFIMNKLFEKGYVTAAAHHGKHISLADLRTNYPSQHHGLFARAIEELRKEGLILVFPGRTGGGSGMQVAAMKETLVRSRPLMNAYRSRVKLPRYNRDLTGFV